MLKNERGMMPEVLLFSFALWCLIFGAIALVAAHFFAISFGDAFRGIVGGLFLLMFLAMVVMKTIACMNNMTKKVRGSDRSL